ncbi:hypothetical protein Droror1_Dr00027288 [Drosera rotundifolia]
MSGFRWRRRRSRPWLVTGNGRRARDVKRSGDVTPKGGYPSRGKSPQVPDALDQVYTVAIQVARMKRSTAVAAAATQEFHHEKKGILALQRNPLRSTFPLPLDHPGMDCPDLATSPLLTRSILLPHAKSNCSFSFLLPPVPPSPRRRRPRRCRLTLLLFLSSKT